MNNSTEDAVAAKPITRQPSDRSTGLALAALALAAAWYWRDDLMVLTLALAMAEVLAVLAFSFPLLLRPLTIARFRLGMPLRKIMRPS
jgi:hypothetical protein